MKKLHLSKKKKLIARTLWMGGFVGAIVSVLFLGGVGFPFFLCLAALVVGWLQIDAMHRCPYCGYPLFDSKVDALKLKIKPFCPKCGERVEIEMEP